MGNPVDHRHQAQEYLVEDVVPIPSDCHHDNHGEPHGDPQDLRGSHWMDQQVDNKHSFKMGATLPLWIQKWQTHPKNWMETNPKKDQVNEATPIAHDGSTGHAHHKHMISRHGEL